MEREPMNSININRFASDIRARLLLMTCAMSHQCHRQVERLELARFDGFMCVCVVPLNNHCYCVLQLFQAHSKSSSISTALGSIL